MFSDIHILNIEQAGSDKIMVSVGIVFKYSMVLGRMKTESLLPAWPAGTSAQSAFPHS
jgi:hypothetical protein